MQKVLRNLGFTLFLFALTTSFATNARAADAYNRMQQVAGSMLKNIGQATWVKEGKSRHVIYVFFDPNCPYCHRLFEDSRNAVKQGKVELRWIPVGILTATSAGKAAAIIGAKDPLKAFYYNEDHYSHGGGIQEDLASSKTQKKLNNNEALLSNNGIGAVPTLLFRTKDNKPFVIEGAPPADKLSLIFAHVK